MHDWREIPDMHGHAKGEHKAYAQERPTPYTARMLALWFYQACERGYPRELAVTDHINFVTPEDPAAVAEFRAALAVAESGDVAAAAAQAGVSAQQMQTIADALRRGFRLRIGMEVDDDPRTPPDAQAILEAMHLNVLIRSVHFLEIDHPSYGTAWMWPYDNPEFAGVFDFIGTEGTWERYMDKVRRELHTKPATIFGHFYRPAIFGHWPDAQRLNAYEDEVLAICSARKIAIEINTRALYRGAIEQRARYLDANERLIRKARDRRVSTVFGSDAHAPGDQAMAFDQIKEPPR